jgi:hypothetical protein
MHDYVIATGLSTIRAAVDDANKVVDSTGGMLTGLTLKQVRRMCVDHKWTMAMVGDDDAKEEQIKAEAEAEEQHAHHQAKKKSR